jgi:hypothetical protein
MTLGLGVQQIGDSEHFPARAGTAWSRFRTTVKERALRDGKA